MTHRQVVQYVEIDVPHCSLIYGTSPCTASLTSSPPTGTIKCFNSLGTCQDRANYDDVPVTMRFCEDVNFPDDDFLNNQFWSIDALPLVKKIDFTPAIVALDGQLGQRATLKVTFKDGPHSDVGDDFDKYFPTDRNYTDPYARGTFWGKFRARNPYMRGRSIRLISGLVGDPLTAMENRHFIVESINGPNVDGEFVIIAKDVLKLASGDRALAPTVSNGYLDSSITAGDGSATLAPSGIGSEYGTSGYLTIGGNEIVAYTRSGDSLTLTGRGQFNTEAVAHDADDRVQEVLYYSGQDPADILSDLLQTYAGVSSAYVPLSDWLIETGAYLGNVYTFVFANPEPVQDLIQELLEQMSSAMWWDDVNQLIRLQVIREISTTAQRWNEDNVLAGTMDVTEQPDKRVSRVIVYFGQINPLLKLDETRNYRSTQTEIDDASELEEGQSIKTIYARGIVQGGRTIATTTAERILNRYVKPPRRFNFETTKYSGELVPQVGGGIRIGGGDPIVPSWPFQDETGDRVDIGAQFTRLSSRSDRYEVEAEEILFVGTVTPTNDKTIILDSDEFNVNLRTRHDALYGTPNAGDTVTVLITSGTKIGSAETIIPALNVGDWPTESPGVDIILVVEGRVQGAGGGGNAEFDDGLPGGDALYARYPIKIAENEIWSGGGGGGGGGTPELGGGGGGAGFQPGTEGQDADPGTTESGGAGDHNGGNGGDPGTDGDAGTGTGAGSGGAAGNAVDGNSYVTWGTWDGSTFTANATSPDAPAGDVRGDLVN